MTFLILNAWTVIVRGQSGQVIVREEVEESSRAVAIAEKYVSQGYSVYIEKGEDGARPLSFVEGNTNVVTSVNAGPGIEVDNTDQANPVVKMKTSCPANNLLIWNGSDWQCVDKNSIAGANRYDRIENAVIVSNNTHQFWAAYGICANLDTLGYTDWRLPTAAELGYACHSGMVSTCYGSPIWSSDIVAPSSGSAEVVNYENSDFKVYSPNDYSRVMCVRP